MRKTFNCVLASVLLAATLTLCAIAAPSLAGTVDFTGGEAAASDKTAAGLSAGLAGEGTKQSPFLVTSAEELFLVAENINSGINASAYYKLTNNIDLGGREWTPIGATQTNSFCGYFDGNGYSICNFKISSGTCAGLFGYVSKGTITKLGIKNFSINISSHKAGDVYAGGLAGYATNAGISEISVTGASIIVSMTGTITTNSDKDDPYVGGIIGFGIARNGEKTTLTNCYSRVDIDSKNTAGYSRVGGIAGRLDTTSGSVSSMEYCYSVGSMRSQSYNSSYAGGLVGYLYSYGSSYSPEIGASLSDDDVDVMIKNSFAAANVYSLSTEYISYVGNITGNCNTHAGINNAFYPKTGTTITADKTNGTNKTVVDSNGISADAGVFKDSATISQKMSFDFESIWSIDDEVNGGYPYLSCVVLDGAGVTIDIGEKQSSGNLRFYEIDGNQYEIVEDDNTLTVYPEEDMFVEVVEKETDAASYVVCTKYYFVDFETSSYTQLTGLGTHMVNDGETSIRIKDPLSIRFRAKVSTLAKDQEVDFAIEEYGYIVGIKSELDEKQEQLNFDSSKYVTGVAYIKGTDTDIIYDSSDDEWCVFTGILKNIPEKNYKTIVTSKTYTKIFVGGKTFTVYGEPVNASMYDIAKSLVASEGVSQEQQAEYQKIINAAEAA